MTGPSAANSMLRLEPFVNVVDGDAMGFSAISEAVDPDVLPLITTATLAIVVA